jgi:glutamate N-acetyltransferase/amino-acid N-acetyltransferase
MNFDSQAAHRAWLQSQAALPKGFRAGTAKFSFVPVEVHKPSQMTLTLITLDEPTPDFAAMFTRNAFPGAPIVVGRARLDSGTLGAVIVNNKISNVCAPGGVQSAERICQAVGQALGLRPEQVLPSSTGVIGWQLPVEPMLQAIPDAVTALQGASVLPAAEGIVTTDLYPKIRRAQLAGGGSIVGIAKGAGMIEPNLATMLVYVLTDCAVPRDVLRKMLARSVDETFNCMSIDSDTSTSDTIALLSSGKVPCDHDEFARALTQLCRELTVDVVRNGEGVHHVMSVRVHGAPTQALARGIGKSIVNSPLFQCAVTGNDPNVGRLVMAVGKHVGTVAPGLDMSRCSIDLGGQRIFEGGAFRLSPDVERALVTHLRAAELYASEPPADGLTFRPSVSYPPHEQAVEIVVDLGLGNEGAVVWGADRTHEYISENADYRS